MHSANNADEGMMHTGPLMPDVSFFAGPTYRPSPKLIKCQIPGSHESSQSSNSLEGTNINTEIIIDFKEISPFQEGVTSGAYQGPDKSSFQEPCELQSLVNTNNLVLKFLPKQADIDKILKVIQIKVLKGTHLPVEIKEIQAGYLSSPYFKDIYLYLVQNKLTSMKAAIQKVETLAE